MDSTDTDVARPDPELAPDPPRPVIAEGPRWAAWARAGGAFLGRLTFVALLLVTGLWPLALLMCFAVALWGGRRDDVPFIYRA